MKHYTFIFLDDDDNALGKANYDRWNKLPWYKRLFGYFFYSYKDKFIDMDGFELEINYKNSELLDDTIHTIENLEFVSDWSEVIFKKYKNIIDKIPDKFLDFHFQNSIRDEQYELSKYISDVAKERGIILKAELWNLKKI